MRASSRAWLAAAAVFAVAAPLLLLFHAQHPLLYDTDSFYHLAVAREVAHHGVLHELPWLRLSALGRGFGDKELLFHWLLAPFAGGADPLAGGRVALALLEAAVLAALGGLAWRAVGAWGLVVVPWLLLGSLEVDWRLVRLRPELLSLLLLLAAVTAAGYGRYRLVGVIAAVYALAYTAFHALIALCWALFLFRGIVRRRWEWPLLLYPLLGSMVGVLVHPSFPHNLVVWKLQNVDHFRLAGAYARTQEMAPDTTDVLLFANLGWWLAAVVLWLARAPRAAGTTTNERAVELRDAFAIATVAFAALYLLSSRFSIYAFPFASVALLLVIAARGETIGARLAMPAMRRVPTVIALAVVVLVTLPFARRELVRFAARTSVGPGGARIAERQAMARAMPAGATVAAPWGDTPIYMLWAPQGRYLNALDPVFMAAFDPAAWAAEQAIFAGEEPDVPLVASTVLQSRYVAWSTPGGSPRLLQRLRADPRAQALHVGIQALFELVPAAAGTFLRDWSLYPSGNRMALDDEPMPLDASPMAGYVDLGTRRECVDMYTTTSQSGRYELAASGPTQLWIGERPLLTTGGNGAVLGEGVTFEHAGGGLRVHTCPDEHGRTGFYLVRR